MGILRSRRNIKIMAAGSDDAERRSCLQEAARLRGLAADTHNTDARDFYRLLAEAYEELAANYVARASRQVAWRDDRPELAFDLPAIPEL